MYNTYGITPKTLNYKTYQNLIAYIKNNIDKIPTDVEFYWDVHSFPFAFFTRDSIPASAIVNCTEETIRK